VNYYKSGDLIQSILQGLTLAMSILPEEIPVAFSTFQALGAFRLLKNNHIIVKQPQYVETLGSATVICADKTGTITQNNIYLGNFAVINYLEIISFVGVSEISCGRIELTLSYRSDGTSTSVDICDLESPDTAFYIFGNVGFEISTGNTAHNTDNVLDTFDGENKYYVILVASAPEEYVYIVQINSVGYITVIDTCPLPPP
jgi:magnesium-transporting ATPase (P-type)